MAPQKGNLFFNEVFIMSIMTIKVNQNPLEIFVDRKIFNHWTSLLEYISKNKKEFLICSNCNKEFNSSRIIEKVKWNVHNENFVTKLNTKNILCRSCQTIKMNKEKIWTDSEREKLSNFAKKNWEDNYDELYSKTQNGQKEYWNNLTEEEFKERQKELSKQLKYCLKLQKEKLNSMSDKEYEDYIKNKSDKWRKSMKEYFSDNYRMALSNLKREIFGKNTIKDKKTCIYFAKVKDNKLVLKIGISNDVSRREVAFNESLYYDYKILKEYPTRDLAAYLEYLIRINFCIPCTELIKKNKLSKIKQLIKNYSTNKIRKELKDLLKE